MEKKKSTKKFDPQLYCHGAPVENPWSRPKRNATSKGRHYGHINVAHATKNNWFPVSGFQFYVYIIVLISLNDTLNLDICYMTCWKINILKSWDCGIDFCWGFVHCMSLSLAQNKVTKQLFDLFHCVTVFYSIETKARTLF